MKYNSFMQVFDSVILHDLVPPFIIWENEKIDRTTDFIDYAQSNGYIFVDKTVVIEKISPALRELMDSCYKEQISLRKSIYDIRLVHSDDVKSFPDFCSKWANQNITIGYANDGILYLDTKDSKQPIYYELNAKVQLLFNSCEEFCNTIKKHNKQKGSN